MGRKPILEEMERNQLKPDLPQFKTGDTVEVHTRIAEGGKTRAQVFKGLVIERRLGNCLAATFSIYRFTHGEGLTRKFFAHSPLISQIKIIRRGRVRAAKLYRLEGKSGKALRVKERFVAPSASR